MAVQGILLALGGKCWWLVLLSLTRDHSFLKASCNPGTFNCPCRSRWTCMGMKTCTGAVFYTSNEQLVQKGLNPAQPPDCGERPWEHPGLLAPARRTGSTAPTPSHNKCHSFSPVFLSQTSWCLPRVRCGWAGVLYPTPGYLAKRRGRKGKRRKNKGKKPTPDPTSAGQTPHGGASCLQLPCPPGCAAPPRRAGAARTRALRARGGRRLGRAPGGGREGETEGGGAGERGGSGARRPSRAQPSRAARTRAVAPCAFFWGQGACFFPRGKREEGGRRVRPRPRVCGERPAAAPGVLRALALPAVQLRCAPDAVWLQRGGADIAHHGQLRLSSPSGVGPGLSVVSGASASPPARGHGGCGGCAVTGGCAITGPCAIIWSGCALAWRGAVNLGYSNSGRAVRGVHWPEGTITGAAGALAEGAAQRGICSATCSPSVAGSAGAEGRVPLSPDCQGGSGRWVWCLAGGVTCTPPSAPRTHLLPL